MEKGAILLVCAAVIIGNLLLARMILPALVNTQNDGALILAVMLPFAAAYFDYRFIKAIAPLWRGE